MTFERKNAWLEILPIYLALAVARPLMVQKGWWIALAAAFATFVACNIVMLIVDVALHPKRYRERYGRAIREWWERE